MRQVVYLFAFVVCLSLFNSTLAAEKTTLSVLPFSAQKGERQAWLSKGIADMLIRKLSQVDDLLILERHELQAFLKEMEMNRSAFIDQSQAVRVGQVAKLQQVIYGNYTLSDSTIEIHLLLVDLNTQELILKTQVSGDFNNIHALIGKLAVDFIRQRKLPVTERELENVNYQPTDSIPATEHFYQAMDHYDQGEYGEAFGHFFSASRKDPKYWESLLWMGKMLEFLGMDDLAISAFLALNKQAPQQTEGRDALLWAAILMEKKVPDKAVKAYRSLAKLTPVHPHSMVAVFRLAELYKQEKKYPEAYQAYAQVDSFYVREQKMSTIEESRQSRFFRWSEVLKLAKDSIINMVALYPKLSAVPPEQMPKPPRGLIRISTENPGYREARFAQTESLFMTEQNPNVNWREKFYVVSVPEGYVATGIEMQMNGRLKNINRHHSFTMRVLPFPLPRNYQNTWLGVIYGQTAKPTTLKKFIPFYGKNQKLLTLQFIENFSEINHWQIKLSLKPDNKASENIALFENPVDEKAFYEGQLHSHFTVEEKSFTGIAQPLAKYWYAPKQTLALLNNFNRGLMLVFVKGELGGEQTELMMSRSMDHKTWSTPVRLSLNSLSEDFAPKLLRTEDGGARLFWISNRRGLGWELWTSRLQPKTDLWEPPNRIALEKFAPATAKHASYQANNLLHYAVTQDQQGRWVIVYRSGKKREVVVITSQDAKEWSLMTKQRSIMKFYNPALVQDNAGVYRLLAVGSDQKLHLWSANDLKHWRRQSYPLASGNAESFAMHPIHVFSETSDRLLMLLSSAGYGLQYARFNPDINEPNPDLVKAVGLEAYAVTALENNRYLIVQRKNDQLHFKRYEHFQNQAADVNATDSMLYSEYMRDNSANDWRKIYARMRVIQPDVTTVAVEPDGRVWWGIETGIMTLKDDDFFTADVSEGFFIIIMSPILCRAAEPLTLPLGIWINCSWPFRFELVGLFYLKIIRLMMMSAPLAQFIAEMIKRFIWVPSMENYLLIGRVKVSCSKALRVSKLPRLPH